jgi:hypothetical protein
VWKTARTVLALTTWSWLSASAQTSAEIPTFRAETKLVLVDVVAEDTKTGLHTRALLTDLQKEDFRVFDNGHEMSVSSFDIGAHNGTRPIALWLIVQCDTGVTPEWHSGFLRGKTQLLRPALEHLNQDDAVGVAHWCDDGKASIDLPPGHDPDAALAAVNHLINLRPVGGDNRSGELAMQKMIRLTVDSVHQATPDRLPILLFLYGDHCATYAAEADRIIEDVLETSGMVFGLSDNGYPFDPGEMFLGSKILYLVHYYSQDTGGAFYSTVDPKLFSAGLDYILLQLHLRYTLGFKPLIVDGKKHTLKVELTEGAQKRLPAARLRFREEYVPVSRRPNRPSAENR